MNTTLRGSLVAVAAAVAVMIVAFVLFAGTGGNTTSPGPDGLAIEAQPTSATTDSSTAPFSGLPTIFVDDLPMEAATTLSLIHRGGPYPYRQDDGVFQNREGILPDRDRGHYREYTVETPGSDDRGARRIVAGAAGERFYTDDHYDSFHEIIE